MTIAIRPAWLACWLHPRRVHHELERLRRAIRIVRSREWGSRRTGCLVCSHNRAEGHERRCLVRRVLRAASRLERSSCQRHGTPAGEFCGPCAQQAGHAGLKAMYRCETCGTRHGGRCGEDI